MQKENYYSSLLNNYFKEESYLAFTKGEYYKAYFYLSKCKSDILNFTSQDEKTKKLNQQTNKSLIEVTFLKLENLYGNKPIEVISSILIHDYRKDKSLSDKLNKIKSNSKVIMSNLFFREIRDSLINIISSFFKSSLLIDQDKKFLLNFEDKILSLLSSETTTEPLNTSKSKKSQVKIMHKSSLDSTSPFSIFKKLKKENLNKRLITCFRKLIIQDTDISKYSAFVRQFAKKGINMFSFRSYNSTFLKSLFENSDIVILFNKYVNELICKSFVKLKQFITTDVDKQEVTEYIKSFTSLYKK